LSLLSSTKIVPFEGKDGLALWSQEDSEKCILKVQAGKKNFASAGIRSQSACGFGMIWCKVTVVELTSWR
jgi:hypothetical protein